MPGDRKLDPSRPMLAKYTATDGSSKSYMPRTLDDQVWLVQFRALYKYMVQHGHTLVPQSKNNQLGSLPTWVARQRERLKNGKLTSKERRHY